jgi:hypothetical protein
LAKSYVWTIPLHSPIIITTSLVDNILFPLTYLLDYYLAEKCYACGDVETNTFVAKSECSIPSEGSNSTTKGGAELVDCLNGICYVSLVFIPAFEFKLQDLIKERQG